MAGEDHCRMDDDPPTDGMCHLRLRTPYGWGGGRDGGLQRRGREVGRSERRSDDAVRFNAHIGVVEPGDEESIGRFG